MTVSEPQPRTVPMLGPWREGAAPRRAGRHVPTSRHPRIGLSPQRYGLARNDGRIWIDGWIAREAVGAAALRRSFREIPQAGPVEVVIDSPGGDFNEGLPIYVALHTCGRPVHVTVRRAFSMAAVIAMAGEHIAVVEDGHFLLHQCGYPPSLMADFAPHMTAERLRRVARGFDACNAVALDIFAHRTGRDRSDLAKLLHAETELDAAMAVALGLADAIVPQETLHHA